MKNKNNNYRFWFVVIVFNLVVVALLFRMLELTLLDRNFLQKQGKARSMRIINSPAIRGMIVDRNNVPLAISTPVNSVWCNPQDFPATKENIKTISSILGMSQEALTKKLKLYRNKEFVYFKRSVEPQVAKQIKALTIPGVYLQREFRRYYPQGEVASQLVGFTNIDDKGQEGLELAYNSWLTGKPGKQSVIKDLVGNVVANLRTIEQQEPGHDLKLSIDNHIQFVAYQALQEAVQKFKAKSGSAVVLDTKTGEVLAMVNQPSYNPNDKTKSYSSSYRNRAVTDVFEPGSTMKAFSIVSALDSGKYTPETLIETSPGYMRVGHNWVRDELNNGELDVTQVLQKSSNVGVTKMTLSLPGDQLWSVLHRVGFGESTGSGFPGESDGYLIHQTNWRPFALATLAFGYGVSVTTLQLASAYSVIANRGEKIPVSLLKVDKPPKGTRAIDEKTASAMLKMLETVVEPGGTGRRAHVTGYRVAGKTGTAKVAGPNGYYAHEYVGSFVGIAPVSHPRIVVAVVIVQPQGKQYYGGLVAAPAFSKIMSAALTTLDIAPDDV